MLQILTYPFFQQALVAVALLSVCSAVIGTYIISRRMVAISGGVTHACFGGLGLGYFLGISPVATAAVFAIGSSVGVEVLSRRFRLREDSAIAVVWALGMALGVLFVFLTPGYVPELNAFLFGNILTVNVTDLVTFGIYAAVLAAFFAWRCREIVAVAFDRDFAEVSGLPVRFISYTMTVLVAVCIVLTIRLVGIMMLMSMMSLPMIAAEVFWHRFTPVAVASAVISLVASVAGLFLSTVIDVPCSALIVLILAAVFVLARLSASFVHKSHS
ncbi:MAG: metal ABC transporter permease [Muribaculaceae bacterium]|nr:metal ABC transporter permease [Muribaculaceae bacterium]